MKLVIIVFLFPFSLFCQDTLYVSFGEKLKLGRILESHEFSVTTQDSNYTLKEFELEEFVFQSPGLFKIEMKEIKNDKHECKNSACEHSKFPSILYVAVDSIRMEFVSSSIRSSGPLSINKKLDSTMIFIDINLYNYYKRPFILPKLKLQLTGIDNSASGMLEMDNYYFNNGRHTLIYRLCGYLKTKGFIQFDFQKYNGIIVPIGWHEEVK